MGLDTIALQETSLEKLQSNKRLTDAPWQSKAKDLLRPLLSKIAGSKVHYKVQVTQSCCPLADRPVLYAVNHYSFMDTPIVCRLIPQRGYIFSGKQRLGFVDWLYFVLNGVIFVDRKKKADMAASKDAAVAYLKRGSSLIMFPEGTWNMTENVLMMPMKWGIIDIAREARAQIIPVILDYDRKAKLCRVHFGAPMVFAPEDNKAEAIGMLRDTMASIRMALFERKGVYSRKDMVLASEREELWESVAEYPEIQWEYERTCIYRPAEPPQEAFAHLRQLKPSGKNAFLFDKRLESWQYDDLG